MKKSEFQEATPFSLYYESRSTSVWRATDGRAPKKWKPALGINGGPITGAINIDVNNDPQYSNSVLFPLNHYGIPSGYSVVGKEVGHDLVPRLVAGAIVNFLR